MLRRPDLAAVHLQPVVDDLEAQLGRDLPLKALDLVGLELDDAAGIEIHDVVVVRLLGLLEAGAITVETVALNCAHVLQHRQRAIDGGDRDGATGRLGAPMEFGGVGGGTSAWGAVLLIDRAALPLFN